MCILYIKLFAFSIFRTSFCLSYLIQFIVVEYKAIYSFIIIITYHLLFDGSTYRKLLIKLNKFDLLQKKRKYNMV